jgi:methyl-accepting chemotaxis protein
MKDKAQQVAGDVKDKAQQVASDVKDKAQQVSAQASDRADAATTTVGEKMTDVAQTLREKAPTSGPVANAADKTAETLERAGSYLQEQNLSDMRGDLESLIRRHPMESLRIGLGIGYQLARSTRR